MPGVTASTNAPPPHTPPNTKNIYVGLEYKASLRQKVYMNDKMTIIIYLASHYNKQHPYPVHFLIKI